MTLGVGNHAVKVTKAYIGESKNGNLKACVEFTDKTGESITWNGSLSTTKSCAFVIKQLLQLGWKGKDEMDLDALNAEQLDTAKDWEVVVEERGDEKGTWLDVRYINDPTRGFRKVFTKGENVSRLKGLNIGALVAEEKSKMANSAAPGGATITKVTSEELHGAPKIDVDLLF
jgi:hypothetical protein